MTDRILSPNRNGFTRGESSNEETGAEYYILGGEHLGASLAQRLHADGHPVDLIDGTCDPDGVSGLRGNPESVRVLEDAGISDTSTVVVAASQDRRNLLIAQLDRAHLDVPDTIVLVNDPDRDDLIADAGHEPIRATTVLSDAFGDTLGTHDIDNTE